MSRVRVLTGKPVKKMSLEKGRGEENAATDYHSTIWKKNKQTNVSKSCWKMKLLKSSNKLGSTAKQRCTRILESLTFSTILHSRFF